MLAWPYQRPWYDAMVLALFALYPATRLDWPVLLQLAATTMFYMPGVPGPFPHWTRSVHTVAVTAVIPADPAGGAARGTGVVHHGCLAGPPGQRHSPAQRGTLAGPGPSGARPAPGRPAPWAARAGR